ncbi:DUF4960 domain-containing protein [Pedobacter aquae]|uniref:DUF4960 domain-containing protein n=1 Tax=Pedobacter aquae TaxID=2605747 RepID=A0A5C0VKW1_9SPHI|nr:DUF4960 domain-containing protein [Pedobacter aquae]QEK53116.1 DUF4960 domain-containing protein [Pedobacter aquae]
MSKYKQLLKSVGFSILCFAILAGCKKDNNPDLDLTGNVTLSNFTINGTVADIDQKTNKINVVVPFGADITSLVPNIDLPEGAVVSPAPGTPINFNGLVKFRVTNKNKFREYLAEVKVASPFVSFKINGTAGVINDEEKTITVILQEGTVLNNLSPEIVMASGVSISPGSRTPRNFTNEVKYIVTKGSKNVEYSARVIIDSENEYAFIGVATSRSAITNADEKAAADWFFSTYPASDYVSFQSIANGRIMTGYKVMWWHYDTTQSLPNAAIAPAVIEALKLYRASGGNLLLTGFAGRYVEALNVVPAGRGPNNVFGDMDVDPNDANGFVETNNDWGISFRGRENHPIFSGLETYEPGKANLLQKGTYRTNHTAWWFLPDWGGYVNAAGWREATGGINLASESWDNELNGRVGIAEWQTNGNANVVIITFGAYDWFTETKKGGSPTNGFLKNIKTLTKNSIDYLKNF